MNLQKIYDLNLAIKALGKAINKIPFACSSSAAQRWLLLNFGLAKLIP
jgi:hypothetical protein